MRDVLIVLVVDEFEGILGLLIYLLFDDEVIELNGDDDEHDEYYIVNSSLFFEHVVI